MSLKKLISELEGLTANHQSKLKGFGIKTLQNLLDKATYPADRQFLSDQTGVNSTDLYTYANMTDLMRVKGIGKEFSELLEACGVRSIQHLAEQNADKLLMTVVNKNAADDLAGRDPKPEEISNWITQAKSLPIKLHEADPTGYVTHFATAAAAATSGVIYADGTTSVQGAGGTMKSCAQLCGHTSGGAAGGNHDGGAWWKWVLAVLGLVCGLGHVLNMIDGSTLMRWIMGLLSIVLIVQLVRYFTETHFRPKYKLGNSLMWLGLVTLVLCLGSMLFGGGSTTDDAPALAVPVVTGSDVDAVVADTDAVDGDIVNVDNDTAAGTAQALAPFKDAIEAARATQVEGIEATRLPSGVNPQAFVGLKQQVIGQINDVKDQAFAAIDKAGVSIAESNPVQYIVSSAIPGIQASAISAIEKLGVNFPTELEKLVPANYSDVPGSDPLYEVVNLLKRQGIMNGYDDNTFRAGEEMTRSGLVDLLLDIKKVDVSTLTENDCYPDIATSSNATSVCYASAQGWVNGYDEGVFKPENKVTRAEALKMVMNILSDEAPQAVSVAPYADVTADAWYAPYVAAAKKAGYLGDATTFEPAKNITRGGIAQLVYNALK